jgi:hypothetical protein
MNENFIQLLLWIIRHEITKDLLSKDHNNHDGVFRKICNLLSDEYKMCINIDNPLGESLIKLGNKMIEYYYAHYTEGFDGVLKLVELQLRNGHYSEKFKQVDVIGHGAFGNVYKALDRSDEEVYAIKTVSLYGMG